MIGLFNRHKEQTYELVTSRLYDEGTVYPAILKYLRNGYGELIIGSPFIIYRRLNELLPILEKLKQRRIRIVINIRDPQCRRITTVMLASEY